MLSYYVEWHMRQALAPILFDDHDPQAAEAARQSVVSPAQRSPQAASKDALKRTEDGMPVHSFQTLLKHLATLTAMKSASGTRSCICRPPPRLFKLRALQLLHVSAAL